MIINKLCKVFIVVLLFSSTMMINNLIFADTDNFIVYLSDDDNIKAEYNKDEKKLYIDIIDINKTTHISYEKWAELSKVFNPDNFTDNNYGWVGQENFDIIFKNTNIYPFNTIDGQGMFRSFDGKIKSDGASNALNLKIDGLTNLSYMFCDAKQFDASVHNWNTSSVEDMSYMFAGASSYNGNMGTWAHNVKNVTTMEGMFQDATKFNANINGWQTYNVTNMSHMFEGASSYNMWTDALSSKGKSKVTDMSYMFAGATSFNQNLNALGIDSVTNMEGMFKGASNFNGNIEAWDVEGVKNMSHMFEDATSFNRALRSWDTSTVDDMTSMFKGATSLKNIALSNRTADEPNITKVDNIFDGTTIDYISFKGFKSFTLELPKNYEIDIVEDEKVVETYHPQIGDEFRFEGNKEYWLSVVVPISKDDKIVAIYKPAVKELHIANDSGESEVDFDLWKAMIQSISSSYYTDDVGWKETQVEFKIQFDNKKPVNFCEDMFKNYDGKIIFNNPNKFTWNLPANYKIEKYTKDNTLLSSDIVDRGTHYIFEQEYNYILSKVYKINKTYDDSKVEQVTEEEIVNLIKMEDKLGELEGSKFTINSELPKNSGCYIIDVIYKAGKWYGDVNIDVYVDIAMQDFEPNVAMIEQNANYGQKLSDINIKLPAEANYTAKWKNPDNSVGVVGVNQHKMILISNENINKGREIDVNVIVEANPTNNVYDFDEDKGEVNNTYTGNSTISTTSHLESNAVEDLFPFIDVAKGYWAYNDIKSTYEKKILLGVSKTLFAPKKETTRAMIATIIYRLEGEPKFEKQDSFDDIENNSWYENAVTWCKINGVVKGYSAHQFAPNNLVTREELITMMYRYINVKKPSDIGDLLSKYSDSEQVSNYARPAMNWALSNNIIYGIGGDKLAPKSNITRAELAAVLKRIMILENK